MQITPSLAGAIHDLHARLASIRIAVSAVAGLDLDEDTRSSMLNSASEESARAAAELSAVGALVRCVLDDTDPTSCDLGALLHDAAATARLSGLDVDCQAHAAQVHARTSRIEFVLPALIRVVAGAGREVAVHASTDADRVVVRVERSRRDGDTELLPAVTGYLVDEIGAQPDTIERSVVFSFESARRPGP
jgi:hypothetical protein